MAQDVGLVYNGEHEKIGGKDRVEIYRLFWDVIANCGIDRRRQQSLVLKTTVKPFSITASKMLQEKGYRK